MADTDEKTLHPQSIKLPAAVEIFANLKNAHKFAIDIGKGIKHSKNTHSNLVFFRTFPDENCLLLYSEISKSFL